ncbi:hypothetical protein MHTCC0001_31600 [Flavobacteriaceae bacterium MHTCC 0001]
MPISKPHSAFASDNKGSCSALADYLEKENKKLERMSKQSKTKAQAMMYQSRKQQFFSHDSSHIGYMEVVEKIDSNKKRLGKKDAKFYAPTISFSQKELQHLGKLATDGRTINNVSEMSKNELQKFNNMIKDYSREAMTNYAKNFRREDKGLKTGDDLVYFGKVEHTRTYKGTDIAVQKGEVKSGGLKKGLQSHVHIIVSRRDKNQYMKLDPTTKEKFTQRKIGNNSYTVGFDRKMWIVNNEKTFDKAFGYNRTLNEKFEIQNTLKNGSIQDRDRVLNKIKENENTNTKSREL